MISARNLVHEAMSSFWPPPLPPVSCRFLLDELCLRLGANRHGPEAAPEKESRYETQGKSHHERANERRYARL